MFYERYVTGSDDDDDGGDGGDCGVKPHASCDSGGAGDGGGGGGGGDVVLVVRSEPKGKGSGRCCIKISCSGNSVNSRKKPSCGKRRL